ncbi:MAG: type II secretion system F family protein [Planctomycetales bacterium]|nr:type II secretion system F family protein [Planctomycetales bacterium]
MIQPFDVFVFAAFASSVALLATVRNRFFTAPNSSVIQQPLLRMRRDVQLRREKRPDSISTKIDQWFERVLIRSGIKMDRLTCMMLVGCGATAAGATAMVFGLPPAISILIAAVVMLLGIVGFYVAMAVRMNKFRKLFPGALELLARAVRAGENLENAFAIVGESSEEPVKSELLQCVRQIRMGLSPDVVTNDLARRIDSVDVYLLAHTIAIHQKLGGRLADAMERLSSVIRHRSVCESKLKSMTSVGRYSVIAIVMMGLFILVYMFSVQPQYIGTLVSSDLGHKLLAYAFVSEFVGLAWVGLTLKSDL